LTLANSLAVAIENEKNRQQVQKQLNRLSALHNIDLAIKGSTDLHAILNIFLDYVTQQLKIDAANVLLYNTSIMTFELAAHRGFKTNLIDNKNLHTERDLLRKRVICRNVVQFFQYLDYRLWYVFSSINANV
jgi:transcriptional regulator with GAF, ATPase, and Fis domain